MIATGRSTVHTRSISDGIVDAARSSGVEKVRTEGYADGNWILIDLNTIVVHVFTPDLRDFYNLERLWGAVESARRSNLA